MNRILVHPFLGVVLLIIACSSDDGGGGGNPVGPSTGSSMWATINGVKWTADDDLIFVTHFGIPRTGDITLSGMNSQTRGVILQLGYIVSPGTYPLGVNFISTAGGIAQYLDGTGGSSLTPLSGDAGTVTITTRTETRIAGTFQFDTDMWAGATPAVAVTNGGFDITLTTGTLPPLPTGTGSTLSATINGIPWNAATITANNDSLNSTFGFVAATTTNRGENIFQIIFTPPNLPLTVGHSYDIPDVFFLVSQDSTGFWFPENGTFTVNTYTATRATGTFNCSASNDTDGVPRPLAITDGIYDLEFPEIETLEGIATGASLDTSRARALVDQARSAALRQMYRWTGRS